MKIRYTSLLFILAALLITAGCAEKSALMQASSKGDSQTVQKLIKEGANIKVKDQYGYDALSYAAANGQLEIMKILIDNGADVDSRDMQGNVPLYPPLYHAIGGRFTEEVKLLVKNGANINAKTIGDNAETILDYALFHKQMDVAASLGDKLWAPSDSGKARIFFIGEWLYDYTSVRIVNRRKDLSLGSGFTFIDVDPGNHAISVSYLDTQKPKPILSVDIIAGQIYYFKVTQNIRNRIAGYFMFSSALVDRVTDTTPFAITPLKESEAKEAIKLLLHN
jgi:ankyrin repeat protein